MTYLSPSNLSITQAKKSLVSPTIICILVVLLGIIFNATVTNAASVSLNRRMFTDAKYADVCFRSLTKDGPVGCSTDSHRGVAGTLRLVDSNDSLNALLSATIKYDFMAVVTGPMYQSSIWRQLYVKHPKRLKGGILLHTPGGSKPALGQSDASPIPLDDLDIHFLSGYRWNPLGSDALLTEQPIALATVSGAEAEDVLTRAKWNEQRIQDGHHPGERSRIKAYMYAGNEEENGYGPKPPPAIPTSMHCLSEKTCAPVGGYSAWSSFGNVTASVSPTDETPTSKPFVVAAMAMDAVALFRKRATGAESTLSHVTAFLSAAQTLSRVQNVTQLPKDILFAAFDSEKTGRSGSRRFLNDLTSNFSCADGNKRSQGPYSYCLDPFRISTAFTRISVDRIDSVVELNQSALSPQLFAHIERASPLSSSLAQVAKKIAQSIPAPYGPPGKTTVLDADTGTPGIPPSSSQSFVSLVNEGRIPGKTDLPVLVLTDHSGPYVNKFYDSIFDDRTNAGTDKGFNQLCAHATLFARLLYAQAADYAIDPDPAVPIPPAQLTALEAINADCDVVVELQTCLSQDPGCKFLKNFVNTSYSASLRTLSPPYYYSSVYYPATTGQLGGLTRLVRSWLASAVRNATKSDYGLSDEDADSIGRWAQYHDALDPAVEFSKEKNLFLVPDGAASKGHVWTESNWDANMGLILFREEDPNIVRSVWIVGIVIFIASFALTILASKWCNKVYKNI